ncbi:alpha/beta fold hydrolase [Ruficoccus amylovorans]|uniref:Alpha/beta fold hydrolase n=1 Tax=Ruficoccus amylovorans TaxID=1804625 RepID=A0A842HA48_9BACT|nr:alpha/beta fold hydrolase [Ruficoccus amylovorans]MBC2593185.1 alpha/beta fold hydrolase [Ruficoccus amylovorans]
MKNIPDWRALYPFESHWLETPAGRVHYVDEGAGEETVVFVHGNPTWSFFYRNLILGLRDKFRCVAIDHLGMGLSDKPQDFSYRLADRIEHLDTLIRTLGLKQFHLVVHDWGGAIGIGAALRHLDKLGRIQIMNTAAFRSAHMPWQIGCCRLPLLGEVFVRGFNGFAGSATSMAVEKKLPPAVKAGYLHPHRNWHDRVAVARFVQDIPMNPAHPSYVTLLGIEECLPELASHPMQIVWGMKDFCFNKEFLDEWQRRFPQAHVHRLENAGHYLLEDEPEQTLELTRAFLTALS